MTDPQHTPKPETSEQIEAEPTRERLLDALEDLMIQADEDCPIQNRSSHLSNALTQAMMLLEMAKEHAIKEGSER